MSHSSSTENNSSSSLTSLVQSISTFKSVLTLYLIPASLYCLYNNLSFVSLQYFNPTTYFMFMQIRLLLTGVIYQVKVIAIVLTSICNPRPLAIQFVTFLADII